MYFQEVRKKLYHKYKYADLRCEYCTDRGSYACITALCRHIMETLPDLFADDSFCEAVRSAERCYTRHRRTLTYLKAHAADMIHVWASGNEPVARCEYKPECRTCRYGGHGFICRNDRDGSCMRDWLTNIKNKNNESKGE